MEASIRSAAILAASVLLGSCGLDVTSPGFEPGISRNAAGDLCARPEAGCTCTAGARPLSCYGDPIEIGGVTQCTVGARYCRNGAWSGCETTRHYSADSSEIGSSSSALIDGPSECNVCNPDCFESHDEPTDPADVTVENSEGVVLTTGLPPGITLIDQLTELTDLDEDGVPDYWDDYDADPAMWNDDPLAIHETLPYNSPSDDPHVRNFSVSIRAADVYFLVDITSSMNGEINNLKSGLTTGTIPGYEMGGMYDSCGGAAVGNGVIGAIRCLIEDTWFGVGTFGDLPIFPYGNGADYVSGGNTIEPDVVYTHIQDLTSSTVDAQAAVNSLATNDGGDLPESHSQALYSLATGLGIADERYSYVDARSAPCAGAGSWGYGCFREDPIPIVIVIGDAEMHNGPNAANDYAMPIHVDVPNGTYTTAAPYVIAQDMATNYVMLHGDTSVGAADNVGWWNVLGYYWQPCYSNGPEHVFQFSTSSSEDYVYFITHALETGYNTSISSNGWTMSGRPLCDDDYRMFLGGSAVAGVGFTEGSNYRFVVDGLDGTSLGYPSVNSGEYSLLIGNPYAPRLGNSISWASTVDALNAQGVKTISISSCNGGATNLECPGDGTSDFQALGNATGSVDSGGAPFVLDVAADGTGLSQTVVDAVYDLANNFRVDIDAYAEDITPANGIDETQFVELIAVITCPVTCSGSIANGCAECLPDSMLEFSVTLRNDFIEPLTMPQYFELEIVVRADYGTFVVDRIPVKITVPPEGPVFPDDGTYWRDYDATETCMIPPTRPDWGEFLWSAITPDSAGMSSTIEFEFQTADSVAGLDSAPVVSFLIPPNPDSVMTGSGVDVGELLMNNGSANFLPYLRARARLTSSPDAEVAPTLTSFEITYVCADYE